MNTPKYNTLIDSRTGKGSTLKESVMKSQPLSGGLYTPLTNILPKFSIANIQEMASMSYQDLAERILGQFDWGISPERLRAIIDEAYGSQWHRTEITPLKDVGGNIYSLHLGYGPTWAFKNVALELLPRLLAEMTDQRITNVLGASSGDTINAAHHGIKGTKINSLFMLPNDGPSIVQRLQAIHGIVGNKNALTILADAPFDPLQDVVKLVNSSAFSDFKAEYNITSFNSINIARILAQTVYYFRAYAEMIRTNKIKDGTEVIFSVPSGNFGDALAGLYAKEMGLPIKLINVATNENSMLHKFFETGIYEPPKRKGKDYVEVTNAPSQDIAKSSNFERALLWACGDPQKVATWYKELATKGSFQVDDATLAKLKTVFTSSTSTNEDRVSIIEYMSDQYDHGIDPHTATAVYPILNEKFGTEKVPVIFLETSHVAQFGEELKSQGIVVPGMDEFDATLAQMKKQQPEEGVHFLRAGADFESIFAAVQRGLAILNTRN